VRPGLAAQSRDDDTGTAPSLSLGLVPQGGDVSIDAGRVPDHRLQGRDTPGLPGMLARDRGAIVNVASTAAFQPVPYMAALAPSSAWTV